MAERIADRAYLFQVHYQRSLVHDDDLFVETDDKGFLSHVQANSDDRTADIVKSAADLLLTTVGGVPLQGNRSLPSDALGETHLLTVQVDPFDQTDLGSRNRMLSVHGYCISMFDRDDDPLPGSCQVARQSSSHSYESQSALGGPGFKTKATGFFYRRPIEHKIIVYQKKGHHWAPIWAGMHRFEQQAELLEIKVDRGAFVKLQARLDFTEGVLNKYTMNKPSELLGFMKIPTTVVNAVVQIPGLTVAAYENSNTLRERAANARDKELSIRQRELGLLVPASPSADGQPRSVMYFAGGPNSPNRSTTVDPNFGELSESKKRDFLARCGEQIGLNSKDCDDAWVRSTGR